MTTNPPTLAALREERIQEYGRTVCLIINRTFGERTCTWNSHLHTWTARLPIHAEHAVVRVRSMFLRAGCAVDAGPAKEGGYQVRAWRAVEGE